MARTSVGMDRRHVAEDDPRGLDFLVIGAQKSGTTSLWQYLREHPRLRLPRAKEAPFLARLRSEPVDVPSDIHGLFEDVRPDSLLGTVTPNYMIGNLSGRPGGDVEVVAARIAETFPDVKLIALLRDPIERAVSSYAMAVRREEERRPLNTVLCELLEPERLVQSRTRPTDPGSLVAAGEYGRVLGIYRRHFPAEQLLVVFSDDLAQRPGQVLDDVLEFLGLPSGFRPDGLDVRHFRGGRRKLLDRRAEQLLFKYLREEMLPYMHGSPKAHRRAFHFFYETWNVAPEDEPPAVSADVRAKLEEHFREDARELAQLGISAPWLARWASGGRAG